MADLFAFVFFFNDTATTEIYTLSLHDALPNLVCPIWHLTDPSAHHWRAVRPDSSYTARSARSSATSPPWYPYRVPRSARRSPARTRPRRTPGAAPAPAPPVWARRWRTR